METKWKEVHGYTGYQVNADGEVRKAPSVNVPHPRILSSRVNRFGHVLVNIAHMDGEISQLRVSGVVARAFLGPRPTGYHAAFKDGDSTNVRLSNLHYVLKPKHFNSRVREHRA